MRLIRLRSRAVCQCTACFLLGCSRCTGLESPIVFLIGIRALYEEEQSLRLSDDERAELIRDNTCKLYMAMTRAGQRPVLTYVGDLPAVFSGLRQLPIMRSDRQMAEKG